MTEYHLGSFVVVNTTRSPGFGFLALTGEAEHLLMPGEEPHTFVSLERAAETVIDLILEHRHTVETAQVCTIQPVATSRIKEAIRKVAEEYLADVYDDEEWLQYPGAAYLQQLLEE